MREELRKIPNINLLTITLILAQPLKNPHYPSDEDIFKFADDLDKTAKIQNKVFVYIPQENASDPIIIKWKQELEANLNNAFHQYVSPELNYIEDLNASSGQTVNAGFSFDRFFKMLLSDNPNSSEKISNVAKLLPTLGNPNDHQTLCQIFEFIFRQCTQEYTQPILLNQLNLMQWEGEDSMTNSAQLWTLPQTLNAFLERNKSLLEKQNKFMDTLKSSQLINDFLVLKKYLESSKNFTNDVALNFKSAWSSKFASDFRGEKFSLQKMVSDWKKEKDDMVDKKLQEEKKSFESNLVGICPELFDAKNEEKTLLPVNNLEKLSVYLSFLYDLCTCDFNAWISNSSDSITALPSSHPAIPSRPGFSRSSSSQVLPLLPLYPSDVLKPQDNVVQQQNYTQILEQLSNFIRHRKNHKNFTVSVEEKRLLGMIEKTVHRYNTFTKTDSLQNSIAAVDGQMLEIIIEPYLTYLLEEQDLSQKTKHIEKLQKCLMHEKKNTSLLESMLALLQQQPAENLAANLCTTLFAWAVGESNLPTKISILEELLAVPALVAIPEAVAVSTSNESPVRYATATKTLPRASM